MKPEILQIERLFRQGNVEIRAFDRDKKVWSGVFDDIECFKRSIKSCVKKGMNVYNTLNPSLLDVNNNVDSGRLATHDKDIKNIRWIPFDIDAIDKDKEYGATDEEIEQTNYLTDSLISYLEERNWPEPIVGFSGNGFHLLYKTKLENSKELKEILAVIYKGLHKRFNNEVAAFDRVVRNPARIMRTYGTVNQKGNRKTWCSNECGEVTKQQIFKLYKELNPPPVKRHYVKPPSQQEKRGKFIKNFDIVTAFKNAGLYLKETGESGKHWVTCINSSAHGETGDTDTVVWETEWGRYHCSHAHCADLDVSDVIKNFGL